MSFFERMENGTATPVPYRVHRKAGAEALRYFHLTRPFLEDGVRLTQIAAEHQFPNR
jgi:hypothetical protein